MQDLRYALRQLRTSPGFALLVIFTLALGVGVNTGLFSIVNTLLLRDLPFKDASRLVYVTEFWPHEPIVPGPPSPDFENWRRHTALADRIAAYGGGASGLTLTGTGDPVRVTGTMVTSEFLDLIGARLELGRNFTPQEDSQGAPRTAILGPKLWRERFGASRDILGKSIMLDGVPYAVIGVLPDNFTFPDNNFSSELLVPMSLPADPNWHDDRSFRLLRVIAHLKPSATIDALRSELYAAIAATKSQEPAQMVNMRKDLEIRVIPLRAWLSGDVRTLLLVLQGAVLMILLIGCFNVANLQIARSISRQKEMALRIALGASRGDLVRQLLTEGMLYAIIGGAAGLLAGFALTGSFRTFLPANLHLADRISIDPTVLAFTLAIALAAGLLTGLAPIVSIWRTQLIESLKASGRSTQTASHHRLRGTLVVAEVAVSIVLLAASGLLIRNFVRLSNLDPGFDPKNVVTMRLTLSQSKYPTPEKRAPFYANLIDRLTSIPGVRGAAISTGIPPTGTIGSAGVGFRDHAVPPGARPSLPVNMITPPYFATLGIPILRGRAFTGSDKLVAIVNQEFAARFFPGEDALGKYIEVASNEGLWREIVGIAGNVREQGTRPYDPVTVYIPFENNFWDAVVSLKSSLPATAAEAVKAVHAVDPNQAVYDIATLDQRLSDSISRQRANMLLMGIFAALAFILAAIGIFSVLADFVTRRSHEIGIRMALGARPANVIRMVLRQGMTLALTGIALGIAGALAATRAIRSLLTAIPVNDPVTFAAVPLLFAAVAAAACYLPALRASRIDPIITLREE
jgi:putative ABC transport system permease protein